MPPPDREWWNDTLLVGPVASLGVGAQWLLGVAALAWLVWLLQESHRPRDPAAWVFVLLALGLLVVPLLAISEARHRGHVYLVALLAAWLTREPTGVAGRNVALPLLVAVQAVAGLAVGFFGLWRPTTEADDAADLVTDGIVFVYDDDALTSIAGHLGRPVRRLTDGELATYATFGHDRPRTPDDAVMLDTVADAAASDRDVFVVWSRTRPLPGVFDDPRFEVVAELKEAVVLSERYVVLRWIGNGPTATTRDARYTDR
jgi:hypothetical protein